MEIGELRKKNPDSIRFLEYCIIEVENAKAKHRKEQEREAKRSKIRKRK